MNASDVAREVGIPSSGARLAHDPGTTLPGIRAIAWSLDAPRQDLVRRDAETLRWEVRMDQQTTLVGGVSVAAYLDPPRLPRRRHVINNKGDSSLDRVEMLLRVAQHRTTDHEDVLLATDATEDVDIVEARKLAQMVPFARAAA